LLKLSRPLAGEAYASLISLKLEIECTNREYKVNKLVSGLDVSSLIRALTKTKTPVAAGTFYQPKLAFQVNELNP
jgi:hypothetical protein